MQLDAAKVFPKAIVTEVTPLKGFYPAEGYHQDYALHHPDNPYIQICDRPKISALKEQHDAGFGSGNAQFNPALFLVKRLIRHQPEAQLLGIEGQRPILVGDRNAGNTLLLESCLSLPREDY